MNLFTISLLLQVFCFLLKLIFSENLKITGQFLFFPFFLHRHMNGYAYPSKLYILLSFLILWMNLIKDSLRNF